MAGPYKPVGIDSDSLFPPRVEARLAESFGAINGTAGVWDALAFGAVGDGVTNDTTVIQTILNSIASNGGGTLVLAPGRTFKVSQLLLGSNTTVYMVGSVIARVGSSGGSGGATLRNSDQTLGNANITVIGGRIIANSAADTGKHVAFLKVSNLSIDGIWIERPYSDWAFFARDCDNTTIGTMTIGGGASQIYEDGFHIEGCQNMAVAALNVNSGDDAVALVQTSATAREMRNISFGSIVARSVVANLLKIEVDATATAGVDGVTVGSLVGDKTGATSGGCIWIQDQGNSKRISRITIAAAEIDATGSSGHAVNINSAADIHLQGVRVDSPDGIGFDIVGVDRIVLIGCSTRATRGAGSAGFRLRSVTEFDINGCRVVGATLHAFIIGASGASATDGSIRASVARTSTGNGIQLDYATFVDVTGNRIRGCAFGIREEAGGCADNYITANDLRGNTTALSAGSGDYNGTMRDGNYGAGNRVHGFVDGDTTPSVVANRLHKTANTAATTITALDGGITGDTVTVIITDMNTTFVHSAYLRLEGGVSFVPTVNDTISFVHVNGAWIEISRTLT